MARFEGWSEDGGGDGWGEQDWELAAPGWTCRTMASRTGIPYLVKAKGRQGIILWSCSVQRMEPVFI